MSTSIPISITPSNVAAPISIITPCALPAPTNVTAVYVGLTKALSTVTTVSVPVEISSSDVSLYQYFDSSKINDIQFYFVYDLEEQGCGEFHDFIFAFSALNVDANSNPIDLSKITNTFMLTEDLDPKTSRGTVTTVRISSDGE